MMVTLEKCQELEIGQVPAMSFKTQITCLTFNPVITHVFNLIQLNQYPRLYM